MGCYLTFMSMSSPSIDQTLLLLQTVTLLYPEVILQTTCNTNFSFLDDQINLFSLQTLFLVQQGLHLTIYKLRMQYNAISFIT